jgi:osmotically-inducible protein OsmY
MADRYEERYRPDEFRSERGRHERSPIDRASDEVRSWFGDEQAERRRRMDHDRDRERGRYVSSPERGWGDERWERDRWASDYDRPQSPYRRWREPDYSSRPSNQYGYGDWFTPGLHPDEPRHESTRPRESRGYYEDNRGRVYQFDHFRYGGFTGRGPKGYHRSDERIREDVCDRLSDDPYIDASDIEVTVRNGEVMLSGSTHSREDKRHSEEIAESVSGVVDVQNNLRVSRFDKPGPGSGPTAVTNAPPPNPIGTTTPRR